VAEFPEPGICVDCFSFFLSYQLAVSCALLVLNVSASLYLVA